MYLFLFAKIMIYTLVKPACSSCSQGTCKSHFSKSCN